MKTEDEIQKAADHASDLINNSKSKYPGMTYEEGFRAALEWALEIDDAELEELL